MKISSTFVSKNSFFFLKKIIYLHVWRKNAHWIAFTGQILPSLLREPILLPIRSSIIIVDNCKRIALDFGLVFCSVPCFQSLGVFDDYVSSL